MHFNTMFASALCSYVSLLPVHVAVMPFDDVIEDKCSLHYHATLDLDHFEALATANVTERAALEKQTPVEVCEVSITVQRSR